MTKVVINTCHGGFGLSSKAYHLIAEKIGKECYVFSRDYDLNTYIPVRDSEKVFLATHFSVPNPNEVLKCEKDWHNMSAEERQAHNTLHDSICIPDFVDDRSNPILISVVETLREEANGAYAELKIVEIPDDVNWCIEEYDGNEWISEVHRTWS